MTFPGAVRYAKLASGLPIAWARSGQSGAPPLLRVAHWMTHVGQDLQSELWRPWLERLGRDFEVLRYDERGCGLSGRDEVELGVDASVEELEAVVAAALPNPTDQLVLFGQSGAAAAAIAYAARHPQRVSHLIILGGYLLGLAHRADSLELHEATVRLVELGWGQDNPGVQQLFTGRMAPDASREEAASFNAQQRLSCDGARAARIMRARARIDVRAEAAQVRCPTLVLHADGDLMVPMALGQEVARAIAGAEFVALPTRNHIPLASDPAFETMCSAMAAFAPQGGAVAPGEAQPGANLKLTPKERDLAHWVGMGLDNLQIGAQMGWADKTVRNALSALYAKLQVEGRPQAVVRTRELRLVRGQD